ncbi:MAG: GAF domain-containing protein, partial [Cyanobacteria bacterium REEB65]|nr:GAF domain-containing protein [Cyanobacteria bacterium REEB65]
EQAAASAVGTDQEPESLRALTSIPRVAYIQGDAARAAATCDDAIALARRYDDRRSLGEALGLLGYLIAMRDPASAAAALDPLQEALAIRRELGDPVAEADGLMLLGNAQLVLGRPQEALGTFEENLVLCRRTGAAPGDAITARLNACLAQLDLGAYLRTATEARRAQNEANQAGSKDLQVFALVVEAVALAELGRLTEGRARLAQGHSLAEALESPYLQATVAIFGAQAKLAEGAVLEALEDLSAGKTLALAAATNEFDGRRLWLLAECYLALADAQRAHVACREFAAFAEPMGAGIGKLRACLASGRLAALMGDDADADRLFGEAFDLARQLGAVYQGGLAALRRGACRASSGKRSLAREDFLGAQRAAAETACPHLMVDAMWGLCGLATDAQEAERLRQVARGYLEPIVAALDRPTQVRYLAVSGRQAILAGDPGSFGAHPPAWNDWFDRPLRELFAAAERGPARDRLPIGELVASLLAKRAKPDEVLAQTLEVARERFGADRCLAVLRSGNALSVRFAAGGRDDELLQFSRTFLDLAMNEDRTLWTVDAKTDPRLCATDSVAALEMRAIACTPVRVQGSPVGALYLDWADSQQGMRSADTAELETLASIAGVCLAQSRLLGDLERRTERLQILQELAQALDKALEPEELLTMALGHCLTISGAERGAVLVGPRLELAQVRDAAGITDIPVHLSRAVLGRLQGEGKAFAVIDAEAEGASESIMAGGL